MGMPRLPGIDCPHCGSVALARSSLAQTALVRQVYYRCKNDVACGHRFVVTMGISYSITPSMRPNPSVHLPLRTAPLLPVPANDGVSLPANDDVIPTALPG